MASIPVSESSNKHSETEKIITTDVGRSAFDVTDRIMYDEEHLKYIEHLLTIRRHAKTLDDC